MLRALLTKLSKKMSRKAKSPTVRPSMRPAVEALEARELLTIITVTGSDGASYKYNSLNGLVHRNGVEIATNVTEFNQSSNRDIWYVTYGNTVHAWYSNYEAAWSGSYYSFTGSSVDIYYVTYNHTYTTVVPQ